MTEITNEQLEILKQIKFKPQNLEWKNFHLEHPEKDRWIYLWCAFGKIEQNIYVTYRNAMGHYELPHPTKQFPAQAWAYADNPEVIVEEVSVDDDKDDEV